MILENRNCPSSQFLDTWENALRSAIRLVNRLCDEAHGKRLRIVIKSLDPESFCALLVAFARHEIDIFLFNPNWNKSDFGSAKRIAAPHWIVGDCINGSFELTKGPDCERTQNNEIAGLRIMIPTGGTSGGIRFAIHSRSTLNASVEAFKEFFGVNRVFSHCVLPLYHVSGFMQVVRSLATGGKIVFGTISDFEKNHSLLGSEFVECRFVSLVPTQLYRLLESELSLTFLRDYRAIFLGGGPASEGLLELSRKRNLRLAPTYGMTETASMVATLTPEAFLGGQSGQGLPLPHAKIEIVSLVANEAPSGGIGRIKISTASLFAGYFGEGERKGNEYLTNDLGEIGLHGELTVHGRLDRVIISGGENIDLTEVEGILLDSGLVTEAAAFGVEDSEWGSRLCVAYVPGEKLLEEADLRQIVALRLKGFKLPKSWLPLSVLPRNEAGKIMVQKLQERLEGNQ